MLGFQNSLASGLHKLRVNGDANSSSDKEVLLHPFDRDRAPINEYVDGESFVATHLRLHPCFRGKFGPRQPATWNVVHRAFKELHTLRDARAWADANGVLDIDLDHTKEMAIQLGIMHENEFDQQSPATIVDTIVGLLRAHIHDNLVGFGYSLGDEDLLDDILSTSCDIDDCIERAMACWRRRKAKSKGDVFMDDTCSRLNSVYDCLSGYLDIAGRDGSFIGGEFNVHQRKQLERTRVLYGSIEKNSSYVTNMVSELDAERANGVEPGSTPTTAKLLRDVKSTAGSVVGMPQHRLNKRVYPLAMMVRWHVSQGFATISPAAIKDLRAFKLTCSIRPNASSLHVKLHVPITYPLEAERVERVTEDGRACQEFYWRYMEIFLLICFGYDAPNRKFLVDFPCIFGEVLAFTACTEEQQTKNQHMHLQFCWRGLDMREVAARLRDPTFQEHLFEYMDSVVSERLPTVLATEARVAMKTNHQLHQALARELEGMGSMNTKADVAFRDGVREVVHALTPKLDTIQGVVLHPSFNDSQLKHALRRNIGGAPTIKKERVCNAVLEQWRTLPIVASRCTHQDEASPSTTTQGATREPPSPPSYIFRPCPNQAMLVEFTSPSRVRVPAELLARCVKPRVEKRKLDDPIRYHVHVWRVSTGTRERAVVEFEATYAHACELDGRYKARLFWYEPSDSSDDSMLELEHEGHDVIVHACTNHNVGKGGRSKKWQRVLVVHESDPVVEFIRRFYKDIRMTCRAELVNPQSLPQFTREHFDSAKDYDEYKELRLANAISAEYLHCHNDYYCIVKGKCKSRFKRKTHTVDQCRSLASSRGILRQPRDHGYVVPHNPTATIVFPCNQSVEIDMCGDVALAHAFYSASYHSKATFGHEHFRDWVRQFASILQAAESHIHDISTSKEQERKRTTNSILIDLLRHVQFGTPMLASWLLQRGSTRWRHDFLTSFETRKLCVVPFISSSTKNLYAPVRKDDNNALTTQAGAYHEYDNRPTDLEYMSPYQFCMCGRRERIRVDSALRARLYDRVQELRDSDDELLATIGTEEWVAMEAAILGIKQVTPKHLATWCRRAPPDEPAWSTSTDDEWCATSDANETQDVADAVHNVDDIGHEGVDAMDVAENDPLESTPVHIRDDSDGVRDSASDGEGDSDVHLCVPMDAHLPAHANPDIDDSPHASIDFDANVHLAHVNSLATRDDGLSDLDTALNDVVDDRNNEAYWHHQRRYARQRFAQAHTQSEVVTDPIIDKSHVSTSASLVRATLGRDEANVARMCRNRFIDAEVIEDCATSEDDVQTCDETMHDKGRINDDVEEEMQDADFDRGETQRHFLETSSTNDRRGRLRGMATSIARIERQATIELETSGAIPNVEVENATRVAPTPNDMLNADSNSRVLNTSGPRVLQSPWRANNIYPADFLRPSLQDQRAFSDDDWGDFYMAIEHFLQKRCLPCRIREIRKRGPKYRRHQRRIREQISATTLDAARARYERYWEPYRTDTESDDSSDESRVHQTTINLPEDVPNEPTHVVTCNAQVDRGSIQRLEGVGEHHINSITIANAQTIESAPIGNASINVIEQSTMSTSPPIVQDATTSTRTSYNPGDRQNDDVDEPTRVIRERSRSSNVPLISKSTLERVQAVLRALTLEKVGARYYLDEYACASTHWYQCETKDVTPALFPYLLSIPTMPSMTRRLFGMLDGTWHLRDELIDMSLEEIQPLYPTIERRFRRGYTAMVQSSTDDASIAVRAPSFSYRDLWGDGSRWHRAVPHHDWTMRTNHLNCFTASTWPDVRPAIRARISSILGCDEFCAEDAIAMEKYASTILGLFGCHRSTQRGKPVDRLDNRLGEHSLTQELCELICVTNRSAQLVMRDEGVNFQVTSRLNVGAYVVIRNQLLYAKWCDSFKAKIVGAVSNTRRMVVRGACKPSEHGICALCCTHDEALSYGVCSTCPRIAIVREHVARGTCMVSYMTIKRETINDNVEVRAYEVLDMPTSNVSCHAIALCQLVAMHDNSLDWRDINGQQTSTSFGYATMDESQLLRRHGVPPTLRQVIACALPSYNIEDDTAELVNDVDDVVRATVLTDPDLEGWFDVSIPVVLDAISCVPLYMIVQVRAEKARFLPRTLEYDGACVSVREKHSRSVESMVMWLGAPIALSSQLHLNSPNAVLRRRMFARDVLRRAGNIDAIRTGMDHNEKEYVNEVAKEQQASDDVVAFDRHRDQQPTKESNDRAARNLLERTLVAQLNRTMEATRRSNKTPSSTHNVKLHVALRIAQMCPDHWQRVGATPRHRGTLPTDGSFVCQVNPSYVEVANALKQVVDAMQPNPEPEHEATRSRPCLDTLAPMCDEESSTSQETDLGAFDIQYALDNVDGVGGTHAFELEGRECLRDCLLAIMKCDTCGMLCDVTRKRSLPARTIGSKLTCNLCVLHDSCTCRRCEAVDVLYDDTTLLCAQCASTNALRPTHLRYGAKTPHGPRHPYLGVCIGEPGVGKTALLHAIQHVHKLNGMSHQLFTCAKLSIASSNAHGVTLDSLLAQVRGPGGHNFARLQKSFGSSRFGIIDEVYAIKISELLTMDLALQTFKGESRVGVHIMFGAMHMLLAGDPFQLPPVKGSHLALYNFNGSFAYMSNDAKSAQKERRERESKATDNMMQKWRNSKRDAFTFWVDWQAIPNVHVLREQYRIKDRHFKKIIRECRSGFRDYEAGEQQDARIRQVVSWLNARCLVTRERPFAHNEREWLTCPALAPWNVHVDLLRRQRILHYAAITNVQVFGFRALDRNAHDKQPLNGWCKSKAASQTTKQCDNCPYEFLYAHDYKYLLAVTHQRKTRKGAEPLQTNYPQIDYCNNKQGTSSRVYTFHRLCIACCRAITLRSQLVLVARHGSQNLTRSRCGVGQV